VGRSGLESTMESLLRGELGYKLRSIGPDGRERYVFAEKPVVHGKDVYLTLDMKIQEAAERALGDRSGAIVAVDPLTGELLAVASSPGFDPNLFSFGLSQVEWNLLRNDTRQPLFNKALNGIYPPGSTFKLVTAAAALDSGTVTPETIFEDNGTLMVRGNIIRNFRSESFGEHTFADAVISSINTTFAKVGLELGHDTLTEYAKRFGFEGAPKMELPVNKSSVGDLKVSQTELAWASVGQARVVSTPLQMARVMAVIANEGKALDPSLIYKIVHKTPDGMMGEETYRESGQPIQVLKPETAGVLFSLLGKVVEEGTGKPVTIPGFDVAGKTGTAEIAMGSDVAHAWFVGAAPMDDPKIAFAVFVERGGVGGSVAGPVAKNFLIDVFNIDLSETIVNATSATTSLKSFWERVVGE
jgi:cell division protein FtsI/penicillin-binding protein 2